MRLCAIVVSHNMYDEKRGRFVKCLRKQGTVRPVHNVYHDADSRQESLEFKDMWDF